ncbi:MAG: helix-turn-helix transcriptional regulator [Cyanobacteria bacterium]|nr:helix-turn-helix transcriptional regulator [Cyanobacteriota bacterium]
MNREKANLFNPNCPSRNILELIGGKWCMLIICLLYDDKRRTGEIKRSIGDISQKMLTQTLRAMEENGLVNRISYPEVPPRVEYELTALGVSIGELVVKMEQWIVENHSLILKTQQMKQDQR